MTTTVTYETRHYKEAIRRSVTRMPHGRFPFTSSATPKTKDAWDALVWDPAPVDADASPKPTWAKVQEKLSEVYQEAVASKRQTRRNILWEYCRHEITKRAYDAKNWHDEMQMRQRMGEHEHPDMVAERERLREVYSKIVQSFKAAKTFAQLEVIDFWSDSVWAKPAPATPSPAPSGDG